MTALGTFNVMNFAMLVILIYQQEDVISKNGYGCK
jgi:hypothetical protein